MDKIQENDLNSIQYEYSKIENIYSLYDDFQAPDNNKWKGKVTLVTITEWMQASTGTGCTSLSVAYNNKSKSVCSNNNWMFSSTTEWSLSPRVDRYCHGVWFVDSDGGAGYYGGTADEYYSASPVIYLTSNITLSGQGTSSNPYIINS